MSTVIERRCPAKGCVGTLEPAKPGTPEQAFCGEWWRCTKCSSSLLIPSAALTEQLAAQQSMTGELFEAFP